MTARTVSLPGSAGTGLWVFMGTAGILFLLFIAAYLMRMDGSDWSAIAMPWQLWPSTGLLAAGSVALHRASQAALRGHPQRARHLLWAGGACAWAFLGVQLWAWQALYAGRVLPAGNPAASFFYLLTALHGLHVAGGLAAWGVTAATPWHQTRRIGLCARYWHFLLAVWILLFATLGGVTPQAVRFLCGAA
jgi:cytochrome c oxidase subunit 3